MHSADEFDLNIMKLINSIYKMRYFIADSMIHYDLFHEWLNLSSSIPHRERIEKFHTEFSLLFRATGLDKNRDNPKIKKTPEEIEAEEKELFIKALFGEQVDSDTYYSGLVQNNAMGLYSFLHDVNNALFKKHLLDNLTMLEEAFSSWQKYHDEMKSGIKFWLTQSKIEIDKKVNRINVDALMKHNLQTRKQPEIITPVLCTKKATPRPKIPLENLDDLPSTHKLLQILERSDAKQFARFTTSALNLYQSFKQFATTHHFKELLELDKHILKALMHTHEHYLKRYCNLVKNSVPAGYIVGKGWLNTPYTSQNKIGIEKYWNAYIDLLKSHLITHDMKQLQTLLIELLGEKLDEVDSTEPSQTPHASPEIEEVIEENAYTVLPNRFNRWNTFYSDGPSQYLERLNMHSSNRSVLKRCLSFSSARDSESTAITIGDKPPPRKISKI